MFPHFSSISDQEAIFKLYLELSPFYNCDKVENEKQYK